MKKTLLFAIGTLLFSATISAQTVKENIDKAFRHPDREKNSAKADVKLIDQKKIVDSITTSNENKSAKKPKRKKSKPQ